MLISSTVPVFRMNENCDRMGGRNLSEVIILLITFIYIPYLCMSVINKSSGSNLCIVLLHLVKKLI